MIRRRIFERKSDGLVNYIIKTLNSKDNWTIKKIAQYTFCYNDNNGRLIILADNRDGVRVSDTEFKDVSWSSKFQDEYDVDDYFLND
jgi:hypothetical protein